MKSGLGVLNKNLMLSTSLEERALWNRGTLPLGLPHQLLHPVSHWEDNGHNSVSLIKEYEVSEHAFPHREMFCICSRRKTTKTIGTSRAVASWVWEYIRKISKVKPAQEDEVSPSCDLRGPQHHADVLCPEVVSQESSGRLECEVECQSKIKPEG